MEPSLALSPDVLLRHEAFVLRLARTLVRSDDDAAEVAQRTLTSALLHPPKHGAVRSWLARVTRSQAVDLYRSERSRSAREAAAARPEAVAGPDRALERLELENSVVQAVLSLDEPYRGIVVATYYEGLTPTAIAAQRGVPPGTVRSQLSRAHELLRRKLDRQHGERETWQNGLVGLVLFEERAAAVAAEGLRWTWPAVTGIIVASSAALLTLARPLFLAPNERSAALSPTPALALRDLQPEDSASALASVREPASSDEGPQELTRMFQPADEPHALLEQSRLLKQVLLDRRLAVTDAERERARLPVDTDRAGVVRMLDRSHFGHRFSLPWCREAGAYYSFSERVHDYNRRPQLMFEEGSLSADLLFSLGARSLAEVPDSAVAPAGLDPVQRVLWDVAWAELGTEDNRLVDVALGRLDRAANAGELELHGRPALQYATPEVGQALLMRAYKPSEYDVLVALEVVAKDTDTCALAYRILAERIATPPYEGFVPRGFSTALPEPPPEITRMSEPELLGALRAVRERAEQVLFQRFEPTIAAQFGPWRQRPDGGLFRLVPYFSEWSELAEDHVGNAHYNLLERSYRYGDVSLQGELGFGMLGGSLYGGCLHAFVALGAVPLESVTSSSVAAHSAAGEHLARFELPAAVELPVDPAERSAAIDAVQAKEAAAQVEFENQRMQLGVPKEVRATPGTTFALRSVRFGSHDVLVALHVVAEDEFGMVLAWKLLESRLVTPHE